MRVYSVLDLKVKEYGPLILGNSDAAMARAARDGVPGSGSVIAKHPEDFNLMYLGEFDVDTGMLVPVDVPILVENFATLIPAEV